MIKISYLYLGFFYSKILQSVKAAQVVVTGDYQDVLLSQPSHLQLVLIVVRNDWDPKVSVLSKQWSSLQLGAHLDLFTLTGLQHLLSGHSPQSC